MPDKPPAVVIVHPSSGVHLESADAPCTVCGEPRAAHYAAGCVLVGCPETPYSIRHAIDQANDERAAISQVIGHPLAPIPYPDDVKGGR